MKKRYYLAYGSNLNIRQMRRRCPSARILGTAVIRDYRLLFKGSRSGSYLTIEPKKSSGVPAAVWSVSAEDEKRLDRYEGHPSFYHKAEMTLDVMGIKTGKVRRRAAFVYIMREDSPPGLPSEGYLETCFEGYQDFGFDRRGLVEAYLDSEKEALR